MLHDNCKKEWLEYECCCSSRCWVAVAFAAVVGVAVTVAIVVVVAAAAVVVVVILYCHDGPWPIRH